MTKATPQIRLIEPTELETAVNDLADILVACVRTGANVGFVLPFDKQDARAFWMSQVSPRVRAGTTTLFAARLDNRILGTVQLVRGLPPNQSHRADVAKLLVHPDARRLGFARDLMGALDAHACDLGLRLLVLDTLSGSPAEALYQSLGFQIAGQIPGFCRAPDRDILAPTTYLYKDLS